MTTNTKTDPTLTPIIVKKKVVLFGGLGLLLLLLLAVIVSFIALSKGCEAGKKRHPSIADVDGKADKATTEAAIAKKADAAGVNAALAKKADAQAVSAVLDTKADKADLAGLANSKAVSAELAGKADKTEVSEAKETADKGVRIACRNHPKDSECLSALDPDAEPVPAPAATTPPKRKWRASTWTKPVRTTTPAPATDPALEQRVSNLEGRMARQEYLTTPLSEYADKHKEKYLERARARLEALDRLPDKVQGESK